MLMPLTIGALALLAPLQQTDTTFAVQAGSRIEIDNLAGAVAVRTWNRQAVRVAARTSRRERVTVQHTGSVVRIRGDSRAGPAELDVEVTVPASARLLVTGPQASVLVDGVQGDVTVETVKGDIHARDVGGTITLRSVEGEVVLERARGRTLVATVNEGIRLTDITGDVAAETVNGDIALSAIQASRVEASTVNGTVRYEGALREGGYYSLTTHNGDVEIVVPERASATFTVSTFNGEIESDLPVILTDSRNRSRVTFTAGRGSARVELKSFNGTVHVRRAGPAR